ncbi:hypothetical protein NE865_00177 [Phthorimaea operculella]|nr:hypothetical protein NE865_00177 [Phthorimaea operculella]
MNVQRSPSKKTLTSEQNKQLGSQPHYGSDSLLYKPGEMLNMEFVSHRNKRLREDDKQEQDQYEYSSPDFPRFREEMKEWFKTLFAMQTKELTGINETLKSVQDSNLKIDSSIAHLTMQNEEFQKKITALEEQSKKDSEYICILEEKIEDLQRLTRKSCVELKNVPRKPQESRQDLVNMTLKLSNSIQLDMKENDINDIFRLKNRDAEKNPTIIVELRSSILRSDFLKKVKEFNIKNKTKLQAKHLGHTTHEDQPIFVSEQLTAKGARLFFLARDLVKSKRYKYCWTSFGRVFVRKNEESKIIVIQNEAQVQHLMQEI